MARKYYPIKEHSAHSVKVIECKNSLHAAEIWCVRCEKHVAWMSKQQYTTYELNKFTKFIGMNMREIESYPSDNWDNLKLVMQFKKEFYKDMPKFWRHGFNKIIHWVKKGYPLKGKHINLLATIAQGMIKWRTKRHNTGPYQNKDHNDDVKGSFAAVQLLREQSHSGTNTTLARKG